MRDPIAWDLETYPIGPGAVAPKPVCVSFADAEMRGVYSTSDADFEDLLVYVLTERLSVLHNGAFDMACLLAHYPHLSELIFEAHTADDVTDTMIREKLLALGKTGDLKFFNTPDGSQAPRKWNLAELENYHLGIDRSEAKDDEDAWRSHYNQLDGMPASEYPPDAYEYAQDDAVNTFEVYLAQGGVRDIHPEYMTARAALSLHLQTCWGVAIDEELVTKKTEEIGKLFAEWNFPKMIAAGVLRPAEQPRPHKNRKRLIEEVIGKTYDEVADWESYRDMLTRVQVPFTQLKPASINIKTLKSIVEGVCAQHGLGVPRTDTEAVRFDKEAQKELGHLHPVLEEYCERQEVANLVNTELPRIAHPVVHPRYDVLKATGRTSSHGSKKGVPIGQKGNLYPAVNIQQIDPRIRGCYVARPGWVLCSCDYDFIELVSIAQKCLDLFGSSVLADKINAGCDPHAYLGAQLCYHLHAPFQESVNEAGLGGTQDDTYKAFLEFKKLDKVTYKLYRTFSKPTAFGYAGGLGAETFVTYAKVTYGVDLVKITGSLEEAISMAKQLKQLWLQTFPEMEAYFQWVSKECVDTNWSTGDDRRYQYVSPNGMVRRNATYCAATNGAGLQTPTAEGIKLALWMVARACYDPSKQSPLLGCHPVAMIHDEIITEIPQDAHMHERAHEIARLMRRGMKRVMKDVRVGVAPTLMLRWNKAAETVHDSDGRLAIWTPKEEVA